MKHFGRKMLGLILAIAMVCSLLPMAVMATTTNGYAIKFEYADNTAAQGFPQVRTNAVFSGGTANQTVTGSAAYYITFTADIAKAGDYTIWIRGGRHGQSYVSPIQITVDGTTVLPELANDTGSFWANSYGINHQMAFQSTTATFTKGSHTIKYELTDKAPGSDYWLGAFDCMVIMPTNYTWTPAIDTMPTPPTLKQFDASGYGWFEETDYSTKNGYFNQYLSNAAYSGGSALGVNQADYADNYLDFYINVPKAGTYDIWVNGTSTNSWASAPKLLLNGVEQTLTSMSGEKWNSSYVSQWKKVSGLSLTAGEVDIKYLLNVSREGGAKNYIGVFDVICIVPSRWGWSWTDANTAPTKPTKPSVKEFHEDGYAWLEDSDFSSQKGFVERNLSTSSNASMFSESHARTLGLTDDPGADGYYMDYLINVPKTDTYDIWIRGTDPSYTQYNSVPKFLINDVEYATTQVGSESWFIWGSNWRIKWVKATVELTAGECDLTYLIDTKSNNNYYYGCLDMICIVPTNWHWTQSNSDRPVKPTFVSNSWIEGETYSNSNYTSTATSDSTDQKFSNNLIMKLGSSSNPGANGYYTEYNVNLQSGTYDIYVRAADDLYSEWMSNATAYVDGTEKSYANVVTEGWPKWNGSTSNYAHGWVKISGVTVTEDRHTIRWAYLTTTKGGTTSNYVGGLDCIAVVPSGAPFTPVAGNITNTKLDYYLSLLMLDQDLTNITEDITLPTTLEDDTSVSWASSNTTAIATNGAVIRPINSDANVTLTATAGGYSKAFAATVKYTDEFEITGFAIGGSATAGGTATATATVKRNGGANGTASLILAIYDEHEEMVGVNIDQDTVNLTPNTLNCSYAIPAGQTGSLVARAFLWTDFTELRPITTQLSN